MRGWSKAVGAGLGYFVGGPIGAVMGYVLGKKLVPKLRPEESHLLIANLMGFTAVLLKADGPPSPQEQRETVRFYSCLFRFDANDEGLAHQLLEQLLAVDLDIVAMAQTFNRHSDLPMRHRLLEILSTVSLLLRGQLDEPQLALLNQIAVALNMDRKRWEALRASYRAPSPTLDTACCYALLELSPEVPATEVRAAYRRLAKKYHPDRSAQLDLRAKQLYVERMTLINTAYGTIRGQKGF
ncbi:MAG: DnaJ domain-containing protein [Deltaproteobacteria bacterium]|nr:MAG: DnaJ domain-containing protein [Deltaproteobacteria bacterium]